jgi:hypothetical protein
MDVDGEWMIVDEERKKRVGKRKRVDCFPDEAGRAFEHWLVWRSGLLSGEEVTTCRLRELALLAHLRKTQHGRERGCLNNLI